MTETYSKKALALGHFSRALVIMVMASAAALLGCGSDWNKQSPGEKLDTHCVRECVLETGAAEICDTVCKCVSTKLSDKLSGDEFQKLVSSVTQSGSKDSEADEYLKEYKNAFSLCKSGK